MKQLHENLTWNRRTDRIRSGLSIIEVLTSIVVAMIGVFGVMILIPFAVKQSQVGLDSDAAVQVGRNAYAQFEINGYRNPSNWIVDDAPKRPYNPIGDPRVFSIDPLGITENDNNYTNFPINNPLDQVTIPSVNLRIPLSNSALDIPTARRMFRSADDLVFWRCIG